MMQFNAALASVFEPRRQGYLAGEYPRGTTTKNGVPCKARIWVTEAGTYRAVASTLASESGTWRVTGLDLNQRYNVVARDLAQEYSDVVAVRVAPTPLNTIATMGEFSSNADFNGVAGQVELVGGLPPYTASVISPLPSGLSLVLDGHVLRIDGVSRDAGQWSSLVRVAASNGVYVDIGLDLLIQAPQTFDGLMTASAPLSWWRLDEASGYVAKDAMGYRDGAYQDGPTLGAPAMRKGALASAGFGIEYPSTAQVWVGADLILRDLFATGNHGSLAMWIRWVADSGFSRLIQYFMNSFDGRGSWRIVFGTTFQSYETTMLQLPESMKDGQPHFIVIRKGADGYAAFMDGALVSSNPSTAGSSNGASGLAFPAAGDLSGRYSHYPARCYLSDVAVFTRALSDAEVSALWEAGKLSP